MSHHRFNLPSKVTLGGTVKVPDPVTFTRKQLEWLEARWPEVVANAKTDPDEIKWKTAQRAVINEIREHVRSD